MRLRLRPFSLTPSLRPSRSIQLSLRLSHSRLLPLWLSLVTACVANASLPSMAAAQTGFVSGGFLDDVKRYDSGSSGPAVYDGQAAGGYVGAGVFVTRRFSGEFEMAFTGDTTYTDTTPLLVNNATVNFTTTFRTRLQTYSALFGVHVAPSSRLHLSGRGGVTLIHHRRQIAPPAIVPNHPESNAVPITTTITENVAAPTAGVDADVVLVPRVALVAALRAHWFTVKTDLSAYSIRPMIGVRVSF